VPDLLANDFDDDRIIKLIQIALARAPHPGPALATEPL
jgi:hypothetical protein